MEQNFGYQQLMPTEDDHKIAYMAALAIGLAVLEAGIPSPIPGVKPGLANIVTLLVLHRYGWRSACWVALLRILGASLLLGGFLSPGFFLSLSGGVCSLLVLGAMQSLPKNSFGVMSQSVLASIAHIAGQLGLVYLWLIPHAGVRYLLPIFVCAAWVFGVVNGWISLRILKEQTNAN